MTRRMLTPTGIEHNEGKWCQTCTPVLSAANPYVDAFQALDEGASPAGAETAPEHYRGKDNMQPWQVWEAFDLDPWTANAVKYLLRAGKKGPKLEDLKKARHYIDYLIEKEQGR